MDVDASDYQRMAAKLKAADKTLKRHVTAGIRAVAKPAGEAVIREGSEAMPSRGGLRDYLQGGGRVSLRMRGEGADLALGNRQGVKLGPLDRGELRHPLFSNRKVWVGQRVPADTYTKAIEAQLETLRPRMEQAVEDALKELG